LISTWATHRAFPRSSHTHMSKVPATSVSDAFLWIRPSVYLSRLPGDSIIDRRGDYRCMLLVDCKMSISRDRP
jgi:hypothetical protein